MPKAIAPNPYLDFLQRYRDDPVAFVEHVLKVKTQPWQAEMLRAVASGERKISIRSGHGVGKSTAASWVMLWYLITRYPVKIVVTAPTSAQLFDALFAELKRWINELPYALKEILDLKSDRVSHKAAPSEAFISCRTSRAETPEALQGVHAENVLLICDEASGIPEAVFEAAAGSMSGSHACTILLGNPTRSSGFFFDTHHRQAGEWWTRKVSCVDSDLVSAEYVDEMKVRYGEESNAYRVRVLGDFPARDDDTAIPLELVESAQNREVEVTPDEPIIWGLDVARFGSASSVLCKRQGRQILAMQTWRGLDLMQLTGAVVAEFESCQPRQEPITICVDSIGVGGGVCDRLRELGLPAIGVNTSESPALRVTYLNLRAELWFKLKAWLEARDVSLPKDDHLLAELVAVKYKFTSSGKLQIESKDEMRKRGLSSPDRADAVCLTFAVEAATVIHGSSKSSNWAKPIRRNLNPV
jgi:phage terminase large subunit